MTIRSLMIFIIYFSKGLVYGEEVYSFQIHGDTQPKVLDNYLYNPQANSQIIADSTIIDIFEWKAAVSNPDLIEISLTNEQWIKLPDEISTVNFQNQISKSQPILMRGCPIVKIQLNPWRNGDLGGLEYLQAANVIITLESDPILSDISYFPPDIINPQHRTRNYENFTNTEYLIISTPELIPAANDLADLHRDEVNTNFRLNTEVVSTDSLFDAGETLTPELINSYLLDRIANDENADLKYLLFIGDEYGIPPYYHNNTPTDDYYTSSTVSTLNPQIPTGRIPVSTLSEAESIVEQIREYILYPISGNWKSKILLLADDQNHPDQEEFTHAINSNILYEILKNQLHFSNLYGTDYIPTPSGGWFEHPELTSDFISSINSGVGLMNYIGHGSATALAHENILNMSRDLNSIQAEKQGIWIVGTCSFGQYDDTESMAEALLKKPDGSIGLITTTRAVYASSNIQYLKRVFNNLDDIINNAAIAEYYRLGDLAHYSKESSSDYLFQVFGDPALPLPFPKITSLINTTESSDTFVVAEQAELVLYESQDDYYMTVLGPEQYNNIGYYLPGEIIFQGSIQSPANFYIPLDISQCDDCSAKITVYSESSGNDNLNGNIDNLYPIPIIGTDIASTDITGPEINLWHKGNLITETGMISPPYEITVGLTDTSGINLTGSMGHSIRYEINGIETILNQDFTYVNSDSGIVTFSVPEIEIQLFDFYIEAWDNVNNSTAKIYSLIMGEYAPFSIEKIYNYPNPFTDDTFFTFFSNENATVTITVFTLDGSKVMEKKANVDGSELTSIYWNGKDDFSNPIANGTYFYHVSASSENGGEFQHISKLSKIK